MLPALLLAALLSPLGVQELPQARVVAIASGPDDPNFQIPLPQAVVVAFPQREPAQPPRDDEQDDPLARDVELSITLSLAAGHVLPAWLDFFGSWMQANCVAGLAALERGKKEQHLHIQGAVRMRLRGPIDKKFCDKIKKQIKQVCGIAHGSGFRTLMDVKAFAPGQTWPMMIGYCTKDFGQPHYRIVRKGVSDEEIAAGVAQWQSARLSYEDDKVVLTKKTLFQHVYSFIANGEPGAFPTFIEAMTSMLNTLKYVPSPLLIMGYGGSMRAAAAQALWLLANNRPITMAQCGALFLSDNSSDSAGGTSHAQRYYHDLPRAEQRGARAAQSTPGTPSHARAPTGSPSAPPSHAVAREHHGSPAASDPPRRGRRSAAQIRIARLLAGEERHRIAELADVCRTRVPAAALGDVVHVGGDDDADWVVDTAGAAGSPLVLGGGALRAARPQQRPKKRRRLRKGNQVSQHRARGFGWGG